MKTNATNQILSFVDSANAKKRKIMDSIKSMENRKEEEKSRLVSDELQIAEAIKDDKRDGIQHMKKVAEEKSRVFDIEHELSELRKKYADVDKKISEMNHWTAQSEYEDESKQAEALTQARNIYNTI